MSPQNSPIKCQHVKLWISLSTHLFLQVANAHRRSLESEVRIRTSAMESFDQMNSSLISANISLQVTNQSNQSVYVFYMTAEHQPRKDWFDKWTKFPFQKSLLENCQNRVDAKEEAKSLRSTHEKAQEKLRDRERELAAVQAENQTLRLQVRLSALTVIHTNPRVSTNVKTFLWCWSPSWCDKWVLTWPVAKWFDESVTVERNKMCGH